MTSKWNDVNSYFPLEPSVSPAYFDGSYNDMGTYPADGFLTKFCSLYSKAMIQAQEVADQPDSSLRSLGDGWFALIGRGQGTNVDIFDMRGRKCSSLPIAWMGEGTTPFWVKGLEPGAYIIVAQGVPAAKLVVVE